MRSAELYKTFFPYLNWPARKNIAYHMQYLEHLYEQRANDPQRSTTLNLANKTIIVELFGIVECIVDNLLTALVVHSDGETFSLELSEYTSAHQIFELALKYNLINTQIFGDIKELAKVRNSIHFKRVSGGQYEYNAYPDTKLFINEKRFAKIIRFFLNKYAYPELSDTFPWPEEIFGNR